MGFSTNGKSLSTNNNLEFKDASVSLVSTIADRALTNTQSVKTLIIEKEGQKLISLQRWWKKSSGEPWEAAKGFHFDLEEAKDVISDLQAAVKQFENLGK
ncbi:hypothetical protein D3C81_1621690 [compost metagenome]